MMNTQEWEQFCNHYNPSKFRMEPWPLKGELFKAPCEDEAVAEWEQMCADYHRAITAAGANSQDTVLLGDENDDESHQPADLSHKSSPPVNVIETDNV